jgi:hypothetical protein
VKAGTFLPAAATARAQEGQPAPPASPTRPRGRQRRILPPLGSRKVGLKGQGAACRSRYDGMPLKQTSCRGTRMRIDATPNHAPN